MDCCACCEPENDRRDAPRRRTNQRVERRSPPPRRNEPQQVMSPPRGGYQPHPRQGGYERGFEQGYQPRVVQQPREVVVQQPSQPRQRVIVITGANQGIGYAIVQRCLNEYPDTFVYLGSRNVQRGQNAVNAIVLQNPALANRVQALQIDVTNPASVSRAAKTVGARHGQIYGLVNNAGIASGGLDAVLEVNVYGVHRTTEAFLPLLGKGSRVVIVSSGMAPGYVRKLPDTSTFTNKNATIQDVFAAVKAYSGRGSNYGLSKAAVNLLTIAYANKYPGILVNSCSPGWVRTKLTGGSGNLTPHQGAKSTLHLLFNPLPGNGRYYGSDAKRSPLDRSRDPGTPEFVETNNYQTVANSGVVYQSPTFASQPVVYQSQPVYRSQPVYQTVL